MRTMDCRTSKAWLGTPPLALLKSTVPPEMCSEGLQLNLKKGINEEEPSFCEGSITLLGSEEPLLAILDESEDDDGDYITQTVALDLLKQYEDRFRRLFSTGTPALAATSKIKHVLYSLPLWTTIPRSDEYLPALIEVFRDKARLALPPKPPCYRSPHTTLDTDQLLSFHPALLLLGARFLEAAGPVK